MLVISLLMGLFIICTIGASVLQIMTALKLVGNGEDQNGTETLIDLYKELLATVVDEASRKPTTTTPFDRAILRIAPPNVLSIPFIKVRAGGLERRLSTAFVARRVVEDQN